MTSYFKPFKKKFCFHISCLNAVKNRKAEKQVTGGGMYIRAHHCTRQQEILGDFTSNLSIRGENIRIFVPLYQGLGGSASEDAGTDSDFFLQFFFCFVS